MKHSFFELNKHYVEEISQINFTGSATEASYYPVLKNYLETYLDHKKINGKIVLIPKSTEAGMPDFIALTEYRTIGHLEAKDIPMKLEEIENSKQLKKYRFAYPNLILTDYFNFILYRNGKEIRRAVISDKNILLSAAKIPKVEDTNNIANLLDLFLSYVAPPSYTAEQLAEELAKRAKQLGEQIRVELNDKNPLLTQTYGVLRDQLIPSLKSDEFADI
ncbi:MAG: hypothetical protein H3Z52_14345, partial [archaeon]|nr:hypothetical protein [archaeon]